MNMLRIHRPDLPSAAPPKQRPRRPVLLTRVWLLGTWLAAQRRPRVRPADVARQLYRAQTRGMGLRVTEWLRDHLRPAWLRVRPGDDDPASQ